METEEIITETKRTKQAIENLTHQRNGISFGLLLTSSNVTFYIVQCEHFDKY